MKRGHLSQYFDGIAAKRLTAVEADVLRSHQHELNGVESLKRLFGAATGRRPYPARFLYLNDREEAPVTAEGAVTWYDARERHPTRSEHRLYFPANAVMDRAAAGDLMVIGRRPDGSVLLVVAEQNSTSASQVRWLFGTGDLADEGYVVRSELDSERDRIALAARFVLEEIGVETEPPPDTYLEDMRRRFGDVFPRTREFSAYARSTLPDIDPRVDPDSALIAYMEREEELFRTFERQLVAARLEQSFVRDVDGFVAYSLSIQNRRKSRVGYALENHLEWLLSSNEVRFARTPVTENRSKPDFLFPGATEYRNPDFPASRLTVLGVKTTCKDRWRQVLAEADRIEQKHLLTLEPAISSAQINEMRMRRCQLVLPRALHSSCASAQQAWLMDVSRFIDQVRERQA